MALPQSEDCLEAEGLLEAVSEALLEVVSVSLLEVAVTTPIAVLEDLITSSGTK